MKKPIIGITADYDNNPTSPDYTKNILLRKNYCSVIELAGGLPFILPHSENLAKEYSKNIDALIISGGNFDIDPSHFGEKTNSSFVKTKPERTNFEINLAKEILNQNKPLLGICGGQQLLHVILGGKLIQHIPDEVETNINHEQPNPRNEPGHEVSVKRETLLYDIVKKNKLNVNSAHHQSIKDEPKGIQINAVAPDGVYEGIECNLYKFCLGVQWHPEYLIDDSDIKIFAALVDASKN
ncbi:MAG: putative glutamine amidotransferase [Alphaproteobacteria bacterium MarineAlpha2_Bin1]|nr:MAG: putative glutamine amidotransferase [Alphaproteobacteria bacterium MarineAlpha2_Bin1]|tara:strand:+ start:1480 stop:2196 length:717 start_codon:yes stop_codon:yes gene_type:complete